MSRDTLDAVANAAPPVGTYLVTAAPERTTGIVSPGTDAASSARAVRGRGRILATSAVFAGVAGIVATVPGAPTMQSLALLVLMAWGGGSAVLCWFDLPDGALVAGAIGLSIATVVGMTALMARWDVWHPTLACWCLSLLVAASGLLRLWNPNGDRPVLQPRPSACRLGSPVVAIVMLVAALSTWTIAVWSLRRDTAGDHGLLFTPGGVWLAVAMAAVVSSFVAAMAARRPILAALAALASVLVGRATSTLITEVPAYTWTYKHIGVVDYVNSHGALEPYWTDIYARWPGFFTAMAWFSSVTRVSPVDVAHWFAPVVDVLISVVAGALALAVTRSLHTALVAAFLVQLVNWVAQDYYSPQALSLVMSTSILALLLCSNQYPMAGYLSVAVFVGVVWTHQLTPAWTLAAVVALSVLRQVRPRWIFAYYLAVWGVYVIPQLDSVQRYGLFSFDPVKNTAGTSQSERPVSAGYEFTVLVDRGLAVTFWGLAAVCVGVLWRRRAKPWAAAIAAFSPMILVFSQSYGGEATMRIFLYSLAGCALLIAPFVTSALLGPATARGRLSRVSAWLLLVAFALAGMQGYYSNWSFSTVTQVQLEQSRWLLASNLAERGITVWAPQVGWPQRPSANYVKFALADQQYDIPLDDLRTTVLKDIPTGNVMDGIEDQVRHSRFPLFVVLPRQLEQYDAWLGIFKPGVLDGLARQLATRVGWTKVIDDDDTTVYQFRG